jgi:hypothetical protein
MIELEGMRRLESLPTDVEALLGRRWSFGLLDGAPYAHSVRLLPDGRIAANLADNERRWRLIEGRLEFLDGCDRRSTVFDQAFADAAGELALVGRFQSPDDRLHVLRSLGPLGAIAPATAGPELIEQPDRPRRPNLVLVRAGDTSVHRRWRRDLAARDRNWDLCVSWYGSDEGFAAEDGAEIRVLQNGMRQYEALHALLHAGSPLWSYDYIALPDDDVMASWRDWNRLFALCREHRLDLAQPALRPEGHVTHPITACDERYRLRFTSFVESMTPIFSRAALQACVGTFSESTSGFGLDNIWPKLLGDPCDRIAIIDAVSVLHTRPQGSGYSIEAAMAEGDAVQGLYDAPSRVLEYGGVLARPTDRQHAW